MAVPARMREGIQGYGANTVARETTCVYYWRNSASDILFFSQDN